MVNCICKVGAYKWRHSSWWDLEQPYGAKPASISGQTLSHNNAFDAFGEKERQMNKRVLSLWAAVGKWVGW